MLTRSISIPPSVSGQSFLSNACWTSQKDNPSYPKFLSILRKDVIQASESADFIAALPLHITTVIAHQADTYPQTSHNKPTGYIRAYPQYVVVDSLNIAYILYVYGSK